MSDESATRPSLESELPHVGHGKWLRDDVPHRGWYCDGERDLGEPSAICQMCETRLIRYVHIMKHCEVAGALEVGCECAGYMQSDVARARERDREMQRRAKRKLTYLGRPWVESSVVYGYTMKFRGIEVAIWKEQSDGRWTGWIFDEDTRERYKSQSRYSTYERARDAAFVKFDEFAQRRALRLAEEREKWTVRIEPRKPPF